MEADLMAALWKLFIRVQNPFMKWLLRSPLHGAVSGMYLLITFTGRKSGKVYTTPVQYHRDGDRILVITSRAYKWWKNLEGGASVRLRLRGQEQTARAETTLDENVIREMLRQIYPGQPDARYDSLMANGLVGVQITLAG
jgi:deazaflavin-dependent oxidoreductase (nitroreductase family)